MNTIKIRDTVISDTSSPFIIAEIGLNHNNDLNLAKEMILRAKEAGANAVKFQAFITEKLLVEQSEAFSMFKELELSEESLKEIADYCEEIDIIFFATPFSIESVDMLERLNVGCYKIASMDINYYQLIDYVAGKMKPVFLSTGGASIYEIDRAVKMIENQGNNKIVILHCVSKYPPAYSEMDMGMIKKLKALYPQYVIGFSDHTMDSTMSIVAKALGANVFEKHFTVSKELPGPDQSISANKEEFEKLIIDLENASASLEEPEERADLFVKNGGRRGLHAALDLEPGTLLNYKMIDLIRPYDNGVSTEYIDIFVGKKLRKAVKKGEQLTFDLI